MNQQELIRKINDAANIIANKSIRGPADFIIVSPEIAKVIRELDPIIKLRKERKQKLEHLNKYGKE